MKNIAVVIDITHNSGGKEQMSLTVCNHLFQIKDFNFLYITTYAETRKILETKLNTKILLYDKNSFFNRFKNKLKKFFNFLPFDYPFQRYLIKNNIDMAYFLDSSSLINTANKTKFIYTILDIGHRELSGMSEFSKKISNKRDKDYYFAGKFANKIVVGSNKLKNEISDIYKIDKKKIIEIKFPPTLSNIQILKNNNIRNHIVNINKAGKYLLYPAQFWEHKNHFYLINAVEYLKHKKYSEFKIIFTGHDKGNLIDIKNLIKNKKLEKDFIIFDFVKDEELVYLYKNCSGVIIPTLVAPHTFPLYEAFYFKKPVIYNKSILDEQLLNRVIKLDVNKIENLKEALDYLKDQKYIAKLTNDNYQYYEKIFNKNKKTEALYKLLNTTLNE